MARSGIRGIGSALCALVVAATWGCSDTTGKGNVLAPSANRSDAAGSSTVPAVRECDAASSAWIFCDDFESDRTGKYFEYDNAGGKFVRTTSAGLNGSTGMRATYTKGQASAGYLHLAFGRTPSSYFRPVDAGSANYRELYWRFFVRRETGWVGNGAGKLTRTTVFAKADWSQAMIAQAWTDETDGDRYLELDPASGTDANGNLVTAGYNDFTHLTWLGAVPTANPEEDSSRVGVWECYEYHVKLNDAGQSNGVFEMWVNSQISARTTGLNWLGSFNAYGMNALFLEQFWDGGAPAANVRTFDNLVVSTAPIGCGGGSALGISTVASVSVSIDSASLAPSHQAHATAQPIDASGNALSGTVTWTSSNTAVATVSSTGTITAVAPGTTTISATDAGVVGSASIVVKAPVASVAVSLAASRLGVGATTQATAVVEDANSNQLTDRAVAWNTSNSGVANVSSAGVVTAVGPGSATITATSEGQSGSATISVTAGVSTISVSVASVAVGGTTQAAATILSWSGSTVTGLPITWTSSNTSIATVSSTGSVRGIAVGTATITAQAGGTSGSAGVKVIAAPASATKLSITTQPSSTGTSGTALSQQPAVQLRDASNNAVGQSGVVVTASVANGSSALGGTTTATTNSSGVATFTNLSLTGSGTATVGFGASGLASVTSNTITVAPATTQTPAPRPDSVSLLLDAGSYASGSYAIEATTTIAGVTSVQFWVDGANYHTDTGKFCMFGGPVGSCSSGSVGAGPHTIQAKAFNASGTFVGQSSVLSIVDGSKSATAPASTGSGSSSTPSGGTTSGSSSSGSSGGSSAEPTPSGTIVFDSRAGGAQSFQAANSIADVRAYFTKNQGQGAGELVDGSHGHWDFTTNYDGNGKHALRVDWTANPGTESQASSIFYYPTSINQLYWTVTIHLGQTATGGGLGSIGSFSPVSTGGGMKRLLFLRNKDDGTDRTYWVWQTSAATAPQSSMSIDNRNFNDYFQVDLGIGVDVRWTGRIVPASSSTAKDGIVQVWRNGVLVLNDQAAAIGNLPFSEKEMAATRFNCTQNESEYWTDLVVWRP